MNAESELVHNVWEQVRDAIPASKRADISLSILNWFESYGFEGLDLVDLQDDGVDVHMRRAYETIFGPHEDDDEEEGLD